MKKILRATVLVLALSFILISAAQAQTPQQTLNQYISDLQKNPNDYALREKIIRHAQTMKPKPAVPEEAQKYMDRGLAAIEGGKGEEDFRAASAEFSKAVNLAPWLGDAYRNLAIAQDKSGQYDAALKNLRLYLLTSPPPADEAWAKSLINKVEYRKEKAARESSPQAVAAKKQQTYEEWLRSLDGARFAGPSNILHAYYENEVTIRGSKLYWRTSCVRGSGCIAGWFVRCRAGEMQIVERQAKCINENAPASWNVVSDIFTISEDGKSITDVQQALNGGTFIYYRQ